MENQREAQDDQQPFTAEDSFELCAQNLRLRNLLQENTCLWAIQRYKEKDKKVVNVYNAFKKSKDQEDFIDSIQRLHKKFSNSQPTQAASGGST